SQPLAGGRISVNGRLFWDSWKSEETDVFSFPASLGTASSVDPYDEFQTEVGARFNRDFGPKTKLEVVGLRTDDKYHAFDLFTFAGDTSEFRSRRTSSETIGRAVLKHQWSPSLSFEAGAEGALNKLDSQADAFENGVNMPLP